MASRDLGAFVCLANLPKYEKKSPIKPWNRVGSGRFGRAAPDKRPSKHSRALVDVSRIAAGLYLAILQRTNAPHAHRYLAGVVAGRNHGAHIPLRFRPSHHHAPAKARSAYALSLSVPNKKRADHTDKLLPPGTPDRSGYTGLIA